MLELLILHHSIIELLIFKRGEVVEVRESKEMAEEEGEEETQMLSQYQLLLLNHYGGMNKHFIGKWLSRAPNLSLHELLEVN